tara:strand:+ start:318 stop:1112 length:795 start_codon:yes stop_codon:yes gene_type:complete
MAESQVAAAETPPMSREDLETLAKTETDDEGLILGKFKSVDDLAASYKELEGKLGQQTEETSEEETKEEASEFNAVEVYGEGLANVFEKAEIDAEDLSKRFAESGELSEDDYSKLEKAGLPKTLVDTYVNGLRGQPQDQSQVEQVQVDDVMNSIGGKEEYQKLTTWAVANIPQGELESFNNLLDTADASTIKMATQGLYSRYKNAMGTEPNLVSGKSGVSGTSPFRSTSEVVAAMKDPRYGKDVTYTENVQNKLAESNVFNVKG